MAAAAGRDRSRWRERFGADAVGCVRDALIAVTSQIDTPLPDFIPIGSARSVGLSWAAARMLAASGPGGAGHAGDSVGPGEAGGAGEAAGAGGADGAGKKQLALVSLLSRVLLALALDYEDGAKLSLAMQLNCLRVLAENLDGVAERELPTRTGVSKEAISGLVNGLAEVGCVEVVPLTGGACGKRVRLTAECGVRAAARGRQLLQQTIDSWGRAVRRRRSCAVGRRARADRRRRHAHRLAAVRRAGTPRPKLAREHAPARLAAVVSDGVTPGRLSGRQLLQVSVRTVASSATK